MLRTLIRWTLGLGRAIVAALLFVALLAVLRVLFDKPIYLMQLQAMPVPTTVSVPVAGVAVAALRDAWGNPRSGGRRHEGIDIFAPAGTPVLSATEGLVTRIGENSLGGQVVWVMGPGGQRHYYAHLRDFATITVGQKVAAGTRLGSVGNTGNARGTPSHLHYGVYERIGGAINPYPLLRPSSPVRPRVAVDAKRKALRAVEETKSPQLQPQPDSFDLDLDPLGTASALP